MRIVTTKADMRAHIRARREQGERIALVPTMGYLHAGHLALVRQGAAVADRVIVSIFVNPTQFGEAEDFASYPRDHERDLAMLRPLGVDGVFMPTAEEMYGAGQGTIVDVPELSGILQGALRPGHFRGVATVVAKLLHIVAPDAAIFGEKDYQQLLLIRRMVRDLDMPVEILGVPTVREADGLAMSSRNVRLTPPERAAAPVLARALDAAIATAPLDPDRLARQVREVLGREPRAHVESVDIRDAQTLAAPHGPTDRPLVILLAVRLGEVLLIDQRVVSPPHRS